MLPNSDPHVPGSNAFLPPFTSPPWGCVTSGPFANLTLHLGPGRTQNFDHCLTRAIQESLRDLLKTSNINSILAQKDYDSFWNSLDGRPFKVEWALHEGGHVGINGDMTNYYTSPNGRWPSHLFRSRILQLKRCSQLPRAAILSPS